MDMIETLRSVLALVLDQVDYTTGNCRPNEMVGAVLPTEVIAKARAALDLTSLERREAGD